MYHILHKPKNGIWTINPFEDHLVLKVALKYGRPPGMGL